MTSSYTFDNATSDPFDPMNLRLGQNFTENLEARKVIVVIPVRKPPSQEFVRVLANENLRITAAILEWQADKELYLVAPKIAEVIREAKRRLLVPAMTASGNFFIWPLKVTLEGERENTWNLSANIAAEKAINHWVNVSSNLAAQSYDVRIAEGVIPEPEWPTLTLQEMLKLAFQDRFIQSLEHPIVKKLKGVL